MMMLSVFVLVVLFASCTWTVNVEVPVVVGVPDITPVEPARDNPAGKLPDAMDHLCGVLPPVAASVWLYAVPVVPPGRDEVLIVNGT